MDGPAVAPDAVLLVGLLHGTVRVLDEDALLGGREHDGARVDVDEAVLPENGCHLTFWKTFEFTSEND
jgi:hypothetical protein